MAQSDRRAKMGQDFVFGYDNQAQQQEYTHWIDGTSTETLVLTTNYKGFLEMFPSILASHIKLHPLWLQKAFGKVWTFHMFGSTKGGGKTYTFVPMHIYMHIGITVRSTWARSGTGDSYRGERPWSRDLRAGHTGR